jgi:hypothetical protein
MEWPKELDSIQPTTKGELWRDWEEHTDGTIPSEAKQFSSRKILEGWGSWKFKTYPYTGLIWK